MIKYKTKVTHYAVFNGVNYYLRPNGYYSTTKKKHTSALHHAVWEFYGNKIIKGYDIHHKDFDKTNNNIDNLEQLSHEEHARIHMLANDAINKKCKECGDSFLSGNTPSSSPLCKPCRNAINKEYKRRWTKEKRERINKKSLEKYHSEEYRETRICKLCGKEFSTYKYGPQKLCSRSCASRSRFEKLTF